MKKLLHKLLASLTSTKASAKRYSKHPYDRPEFISGSFKAGSVSFEYMGCTIEELRSPNGVFKIFITFLDTVDGKRLIQAYTVARAKKAVRCAATGTPMD